ncbi:unnamed protein product, partial [Amoebophrya sp. A120]
VLDPLDFESHPLQAIGIVVQTGTATTKGEMIRKILYPTPVQYKFNEQFTLFLFLAVAIYA